MPTPMNVATRAVRKSRIGRTSIRISGRGVVQANPQDGPVRVKANLARKGSYARGAARAIVPTSSGSTKQLWFGTRISAGQGITRGASRARTI